MEMATTFERTQRASTRNLSPKLSDLAQGDGDATENGAGDDEVPLWGFGYPVGIRVYGSECGASDVWYLGRHELLQDLLLGREVPGVPAVP